MKMTERLKLSQYYWPSVALLAIINLNTVIVGFHPHHDGLMLSTIRLLKASFLSGGDYPFNQYGSFWAMPYLGISFLVPDNSLLFSMRMLTFLLYLLTGFLTYKTANFVFGQTVAKISLIIFILSRPIGLEPMPWPSSIGMFLTTLIAFFSVKVASMTPSRQRSFILFVLGAIVIMSILTRVQIGALTLLFICGYLAVVRFKDLFPFLAGSATFSALFGAWLNSMNWLSDSLWDQFAFGWIVASSAETDRPLPQTSMVFFLLLIGITYLLQKRGGALTSGNHFKLLVYPACLAGGVFAVFNPSLIQNLIGKFWVAVMLFTIVLFAKMVCGLYKAGRRSVILLGLLGIANASQIFPLFDPMHAWWGLTPLLIILSDWLVNSQKSILAPVLRLPIYLGISILALLPYLTLSMAQNNSMMNRNDLSFIYTSKLQAEVNEKERRLFLSKIPEGSSVLNLCMNSNVFFNPKMASSISRYFVYWPLMKRINRIEEELLTLKPDFVIFCDLSTSKISQAVENRFTKLPYQRLGSLEDQYSLDVYGLPLD
jgi:hypothetical protein